MGLRPLATKHEQPLAHRCGTVPCSGGGGQRDRRTRPRPVVCRTKSSYSKEQERGQTQCNDGRIEERLSKIVVDGNDQYSTPKQMLTQGFSGSSVAKA